MTYVFPILMIWLVVALVLLGLVLAVGLAFGQGLGLRDCMALAATALLWPVVAFSLLYDSLARRRRRRKCER